MKRLYIRVIFILIVVLGLITSCKEEDKFIFTDANMYFEQPNSTINENAGILLIPVHTTIEGSFTATLTVSTDAVEGADYNILSGTTLNFPEGVFSDTIRIEVIDNVDIDGDKILNLSLTSSDNINIGFSGLDNLNSTHIATIQDNDCPLDINDWLGTYTCIETDYGSGTSTSYVVNITIDSSDPDNRSLIIDNFFESGRLRVSLDPCPELAIYDDTTPIFAFQGTDDVFLERLDFNDELLDGGLNLNPSVLGDWGFFNDETKTITLRGRMYVPSLGGGFGAYEFIMTKN